MFWKKLSATILGNQCLADLEISLAQNKICLLDTL